MQQTLKNLAFQIVNTLVLEEPNTLAVNLK